MVTEYLLIRTRADAVAAVWDQFFTRFPDRPTLAASNHEEVAAAVRSLGLRWRAAALLRWARNQDAEYGSGTYVPAAAWVSVNNSGVLPIDVTIARVIVRLIGEKPGPESRRSTRVRSWVDSLGVIDRNTFHAFLDLAALLCLPRAPRCDECPLLLGCVTGERLARPSHFDEL